MDSDFIAEQEDRRARGLDDKIYDVTAWSVPLMMNVRAESCNRLATVSTTPAGPDLIQAPELPDGEAKVAYLVPWGERTAIRFLSHALDPRKQFVWVVVVCQMWWASPPYESGSFFHVFHLGLDLVF